MWDPATNLSDAVAGPPSAVRIGGVARLLPDGRVRIGGGREHPGGGVPADEIFAPELSAFLEPNLVPVEPEPADVAGVLPAHGSVDVAPASRISLRFATPIDGTSIRVALDRLDGPSADAVPVSIVSAEGGLLVFLTPRAGLADDAQYRVTLERAQRADGRRLPPFSWTFRTARQPDPADTDRARLERADRDAGGLDSPWRKLPPLQAPPGVTALAGQVLLLNGQPLANVTLAIGTRDVRTDRTGRFLLRLGSEPSGWRELLIDGRSANRGRRTYGVFEVAVQIVGRKTAPLPYTIWMPQIDTANAVRIPSPTTAEVVVTSPHLPGLELHLPPNTVITDHEGKVVREVSITPIPVAQPPFPLPSGVQVPVYFTIQPGGAYVAVKVAGYGQRRGAWLAHPNHSRHAAGTELQFWHDDPAEKGWQGKVAPGEEQVVPTPSTVLYEFTTHPYAMFLWSESVPGRLIAG